MMRWLLALPFILLASVAQAQCPPIPFVFSPGNPIQSGQVNENFTATLDCAEGAYQALDAVRQSTTENPTPGSYFVSKSGSDVNDCLTSTVSGGHGPCLTINRGLEVALSYDARQRPAIINIGAGTYNENVAVNGPIVGGVDNTPFVTSKVSTPALIFRGASAASTIVNNVPTISGQSYCYTFLADNGATFSLQKLTVTATTTPGTCNQSPLFAQRNGQIYIDEDVTVGPAFGNLISLEEGGQVYVDAGCQICNSLTLTGGSTNGNGINIDGQSMFTADSTVNLSGAQTFGGTIFLLAESQSTIKLRGNPAVTSGASVTAGRFYISGNSSLVVATPPASWPGQIGGVEGGGRYNASDNDACIGGTVGCPALNAPTGLGGSGTAGISALSGMYGGFIQLLPVTGGGPAPAATGLVEVAWPIGFPIGGVCSVAAANGTGTWTQPTFTTSGLVTPAGFGITWTNDGGGTNLTTGQTYFISYVCNSAK